jgi:endonuclease/exonuclease/phosphatase family metal-dependent hydrolase
MGVRNLIEGAAGTAPAPDAGSIRVVTWNMGWLLEATSEERLRNIRSVVDSLQPHILALQEVESREALLRALPPDFQIAMADDPLEDQELAIAVRKPATISSKAQMLFTDAKHDYAFPSRRNLLRIQVRVPGGQEVTCYVVHYKSRGGGRLETDPSRVAASRFILDYLRSRKNQNVIILGDFNDTPGDESVDILESGNYDGKHAGDPYLVNLMQPFYDDDFVTQGYFRMYRGSSSKPVVRGAKGDNDRLRGMDYAFPADVNVTQALFDQILVSTNLAKRVERTNIYFAKNALAGRESDVKRNKDGVAIINRHGTLASDHLPVYVDISFGEIESNGAPKQSSARDR